VLEKLYVFGRILQRKLPKEKQKLPKEVTQQVDLYSIKIQYSGKGLQVQDGVGGKFKPGEENPMGGAQDFLEPLSVIIKHINEKYTTNFTDKDKIVADALLNRLKKDKTIEEEIRINPKESVWYSFERKFNEELQGAIEENFDFYKKLNHDKNVKDEMMKQMFASLYENMRGAV
jgi:type I restriction enzyme R subunit